MIPATIVDKLQLVSHRKKTSLQFIDHRKSSYDKLHCTCIHHNPSTADIHSNSSIAQMVFKRLQWALITLGLHNTLKDLLHTDDVYPLHIDHRRSSLHIQVSIHPYNPLTDNWLFPINHIPILNLKHDIHMDFKRLQSSAIHLGLHNTLKNLHWNTRVII